MEPITLQANGPFNLEHTLDSGQAFRWRRNGEWWCGVVGRNVWRVRQTPGGLELLSAPSPAQAVAAEACSYFRVEDDLAAVYRRIGADPRIARAIRRYRGLRLLRQDPWECLVSFVISAYSNIKRISLHIEQISERWGDPIAVDEHTRHTFPSIAQLAEAGEPEFRALGLGYRAKYLARLAPTILERRLDLATLRRRPYSRAKSALLKLDGVGEKVADCVLLFSLDKLQAFPVDVHIRRAVTRWYLGGQKATDRIVREWAREHFGGDAGYAQQYLFHGQRLDGAKKRRATTSART